MHEERSGNVNVRQGNFSELWNLIADGKRRRSPGRTEQKIVTSVERISVAGVSQISITEADWRTREGDGHRHCLSLIARHISCLQVNKATRQPQRF